MQTQNRYWIWFQLLFGIGTRRAELLMNYFEHPAMIFDGIESNGGVVGILQSSELAAAEQAMENAREIERRTLAKGCVIITPDQSEYPPLLRSLYDRPAALYVKGDLTCLQGAHSIAMVGTRKRTEYGQQAAAFFAKHLAQNAVVVVSGLAPGIDADCHQAALQAGGKTIGVLGCGIDVDYPKPSRSLKTAMSKNGAVVTEFPLGTTPYPANFPLRNRLLSGMTQGTLVVEADKHSGSLITARLALEQGRDLFVVPSSIFSRTAQGNHLLLKHGARPVDCVEDILSVYDPEKFFADGTPPDRDIVQSVPIPVEMPAPKKKQTPAASPAEKPSAPPAGEPAAASRPLPSDISPKTTRVYQVFDQDTLTVDDLEAATGLATGDIMSALTELEIYGYLQCYPGRRFGRI